MAYIKRYSTDLTDKQWLLLAPHIPKEKDGGRPRSVDVREIVALSQIGIDPNN